MLSRTLHVFPPISVRNDKANASHSQTGRMEIAYNNVCSNACHLVNHKAPDDAIILMNDNILHLKGLNSTRIVFMDGGS